MKGQKISDRYQIIKSIGEGGMANVYLAYDTILDRNVAVKVLRGDLSSDEKFVRRFQREALSASSLNHPNIVEVYDVGDDNGQYYIVMEYIEGKHLKELLKKRGHLTLTEVVDIMLQITDGMSVAHDSYIIHRDIKPQNIMILENGLVKITDFGIAMAMNATQLTQTNSVMGSVHYLPPEQANGKGASLQSDIYSMGILMYELLTGKLPYRGENAVEIALKHLKEPLPSIREEIPSLPNSIENIIKKATAKNIKNRYNDAREMHEDLLTCLDDSRKDEPIIEYKYSENNYDDTKMVKIIKEQPKEKDANKEDTGKIAKQIKPDELKKQNKLIVILASIFTGLVVIITTILVLVPYLSGGKETKVPDVTNKSIKDAIDTLQDAGFKVSDEQEEIPSTEIKEGNVVETKPEAGIKRAKGTTIKLYVSIGDKGVDIEDYTGKDAKEIKGELKALGLIAEIETKETEDDKEHGENEIIDQSIKAGEKVAPGTRITLYIADSAIEYPDFTDGSYSKDEIQNFCTENELECSFEEVEDSSHEAGAIISQSRPEGSKVVKGVKLKIIIAKELSQPEEQADSEEWGN